MKKILFFLILLIFISIPIIDKKEKQVKENENEIRGVYISYIEISEYLKDKDEQESKNNIKEIINNIKKMKLNTIILHVRPSTDAIYKSDTFPISKYLSSNNYYSYDVLNYFIKESHKNNINLYAWINPYRISTTDNINEIKTTSPAYKYLGTDIVYVNNGIYFNPSKKETNAIIIKGIKEVLNYDIDAIIFDDYFYPDNEIDNKDYQEFIKNNGYVRKEEYNLNIINNMIKEVHEECKNKNILFGISPDGNIENNYQKNYADVKKWLASSDYVDFIIPQLYYGFENSTKPYINTIDEWQKLVKNNNINFYVALAAYKANKEDSYAKKGINEWIENDDILMKQVIYSRNIKRCKGFILYRYDNIFNSETTKKEIENLKKVLN